MVALVVSSMRIAEPVERFVRYRSAKIGLARVKRMRPTSFDASEFASVSWSSVLMLGTSNESHVHDQAARLSNIERQQVVHRRGQRLRAVGHPTHLPCRHPATNPFEDLSQDLILAKGCFGGAGQFGQVKPSKVQRFHSRLSPALQDHGIGQSDRVLTGIQQETLAIVGAVLLDPMRLLAEGVDRMNRRAQRDLELPFDGLR